MEHSETSVPASSSAIACSDAETLRTLIVDALKKQGFELRGNQLCLPENLDKGKIRFLHAEAARHKTEKRKKGLRRYESSLLERFAFGSEVVPEKIEPVLVEVLPKSTDELLFRYASLHWSIPVSSGYGRRLRFLVLDQNTEKLIGIFGLGDPVFGLKDRDNWVGWNKEGRRERLHHVVDSYVLGAVPPYSFLLGGKLIALLTVSNEVRKAFRRKYAGNSSIIQGRKLSGHVALITTTSALGRSSLYNRLRFNERLVFERVGHTQGFGEFHFSNGLYDSIVDFAKSRATATAKHELWGSGFRNKREVVRKTLAELGIPMSWNNHGIRREIYVSPLAKNTRDFLNGTESHLDFYDQSADSLFEWFRSRWLIPRSKTNQTYRDWIPENWSLWKEGQIDG
ncbi:MAG: DUF4338 domain-containing protein [Caldilineaceae bacterium]|nr:DUF4338 domain-containing protein [Caldilineaceae bacterium]